MRKFTLTLISLILFVPISAEVTLRQIMGEHLRVHGSEQMENLDCTVPEYIDDGLFYYIETVDTVPFYINQLSDTIYIWQDAGKYTKHIFRVVGSEDKISRPYVMYDVFPFDKYVYQTIFHTKAKRGNDKKYLNIDSLRIMKKSMIDEKGSFPFHETLVYINDGVATYDTVGCYIPF